MNKQLLIALVIVSGLVGGYFYYYNNVEEITEYYLVKYTPQHEEEGLYGSTMSNPKVEFTRLDEYESDSVAIKQQSQKAKSFKEMVLKDFSEEKFDDGNELKNMAKRNAYLDILNEERILLSITHVRSMDEEEAFNIIKEHGIFSKDIVEYAQGKKLKTNIYPL